MLAKPWKSADDTALPTIDRKVKGETLTRKDGGTASAKRRQGILQAAGEFAAPQRLIQLRKSEFAEVDRLTLMGRQQFNARQGKCVEVPPESNKIVACRKRSE
jgi:hypothetical protein